MNKLTLLDVKGAIWDKRFRELFPEYKDALEKFLKDPGCSCNIGIVKDLMSTKRSYAKIIFQPIEIVSPDEEDAKIKNSWGVINCPIAELEDRLRLLDKTKRMVSAARFKDRITVITNDFQAAFYVPSKPIEEHIKESKVAKMNWKVINTNTKELIHELRKLPEGRKMITLSRFQDQLTAIVNDMSVLF